MSGLSDEQIDRLADLGGGEVTWDHTDSRMYSIPTHDCVECGESIPGAVWLATVKRVRDDAARLRKMRVRVQDILGHTVPRELSAELANLWAAAIRELDGGGE